MDLERFCVVLSKCFYADGILEKSPDPRDVYLLLIEILYEEAERIDGDTEELKKLWVQNQNLVDWTSEFADVYPDKVRTFIHVGGLFSVFYMWISAIGYELMEIPRPENTTKYYDWVDPQWTHVYEFIDGFHNGLFDFCKEFDRKNIGNAGYSNFEAFHAAKEKGVDYEKVVSDLKQRNKAQSEAVSQINAAIESGFYLEAITLQECLISNCIYNSLKAKKNTPKSATLYELIKKATKKSTKLNSDDRELFEKIEVWRKKRNTAIHGFISSDRIELNQSRLEFIRFSEDTAKEGVELCRGIGIWFEYESVNYFETRFPKEIKLDS
jgi:hypothetical protein